jgi:hypothetical protein
MKNVNDYFSSLSALAVQDWFFHSTFLPRETFFYFTGAMLDVRSAGGGQVLTRLGELDVHLLG